MAHVLVLRHFKLIFDISRHFQSFDIIFSKFRSFMSFFSFGSFKSSIVILCCSPRKWARSRNGAGCGGRGDAEAIKVMCNRGEAEAIKVMCNRRDAEAIKVMCNRGDAEAIKVMRNRGDAEAIKVMCNRGDAEAIKVMCNIIWETRTRSRSKSYKPRRGPDAVVSNSFIESLSLFFPI